jgi:putative ABC transport system permease protein
VIGIAPEGFHGVYKGFDMEGYLPLRSLISDEAPEKFPVFTSRTDRPLTVLGRLKPQANLAEARVKMNVLMRGMEERYPATDKGIEARVIPETQARPIPLHTALNLLPFIRFTMLFLAALVLIVACLNITNILLVRATVRQREMAIRAALGSGRGRLIRQAMTESMLLTLLGAAAGVVLGKRVGQAFADALPKVVPDMPISFDVHFDAQVFLYAAAAALLAGVFIGIWPALRASSADPGSALHEGGRSNSSGPRGLRMRGILVAGQVAGSLVLLIAAGLFVRSLQTVQSVDLGFAPDHVLNARLNPQWVGYDRQRTEDFYRELKRRVETWSEVRSASLAFSSPFGLIGGGETIYVEGRPADPEEQPPGIGYNTVDTSYFDTMQIKILRGRVFRDSDTEAAPRVAIVNQTMARRYWPNQDPIGKRFRMGTPTTPYLEVIGVAHDGKYLFVVEGGSPYFYVPFTQVSSSMRTLQIRSTVDPELLNTRLEREIHAMDPAIPVSLQTMEGAVDGAQGFFLLRVGAVQAGAMGLLGLILAAVGVYGVMSYGTAQRTREIGIRVALGATPQAILGSVLRQGVGMVFLGVGAGLLGAAAITRVLGTFLWSVSLTDPLAFVAIPTLLAAVALSACYLPARRAMLVAPMVALRHE